MASICSVIVHRVKPEDVHLCSVQREGEPMTYHIQIGDLAIMVPGDSLAAIAALGERIANLARDAEAPPQRDPFLPVAEPMDAYDVDSILQI